MLSVLSLGHPLQPEPLRAVAGARCPGSNPPKGLLYNHMSKTGGTTMKLLLTSAMGVKNSEGNVTLHNVADHIKGNDKSLGTNKVGADDGAPLGALIFQDDTHKDLQARASRLIPPTPPLSHTPNPPKRHNASPCRAPRFPPRRPPPPTPPPSS